MKENGNLNAKRVTVLTGHYGSGKTSLAVNWALWLSESGRAVTVADLGIMTPGRGGAIGAFLGSSHEHTSRPQQRPAP